MHLSGVHCTLLYFLMDCDKNLACCQLVDIVSCWLLQFNPEKCVVMHVGHSDNTRYHLQQDGKKWELKSGTEERDLGVIITSDLRVSRQCLNAVSKANKVLGMVSRQFRNLNKASFLILYK